MAAKFKKKKKKKILIVDGYNIINAWDDLNELSKINLESSREKLVDYMIEFSKYMGYKTTIVFDAYNVKNSAGYEEKRSDSVEIVFTKEHQTADSYIEKYIAELPNKEFIDLKVATSDYAEQQIVLGKGAARISARELQLDVMKSKEKIGEKNSSHKKTIQRNTIGDRLSHENREVWDKLERMRINKK
ncbi:NYN domain-containing protein [Peptostreptococcaceae bacterium]|uniref:NYN domain-containing protein n=1 Tax=Peptacetobacter sp. AB845 TaxID=3388429 RepID=UPI0015B843E2